LSQISPSTFMPVWGASMIHKSSWSGIWKASS
jgi:hypothetical protein